MAEDETSPPAPIRVDAALQVMPVSREALARGEAVLRQGLAAHAEPHLTLAGRTLPKADRGGGLHLLRSGWVARIRSLPDGRQAIIDVYVPRDFVNLDGALGLPAPDRLVALGDVSRETVDAAALRRLIGNPDAALALMALLVMERRRQDRLALRLARMRTEERMAGFLLDMRPRLRRTRLLSADGRTFRVPMTQRQIADHLGLTEMHVGRTLRKLREAGIAELRSGVATIRDLRRVRRLGRGFVRSDADAATAEPDVAGEARPPHGLPEGS
jgi:CRP-like cAMP-binding protein